MKTTKLVLCLLLIYWKFIFFGNAMPYGADFYNTSEYMMGKIAVSIIFVESDGTVDVNTEDWTETMKNTALNKIFNGLDWLASLDTRANISFTYTAQAVTTKYEPINRPSTDQNLWMCEIMGKLGYSGTYADANRKYCNDLRDKYQTDWAYVIYVVNSKNDADGMFTNTSWFAYARLGGPYIVMTYTNDGWGINNMDSVVAHETCHIFRASDEYNDTLEYSGYLYEPDNDGVNCIMNNNDKSMCTNTRCQVGWKDSNNNNIFNILDTNPETRIINSNSSVNSDNSLVYKISGSANVTAYPKVNQENTKITIKTIQNVRYRIDNGIWQNASASDGSFDNYVENFEITLSNLTYGSHTIEAQAVDSSGKIDSVLASIKINIADTTPPAKIALVNDGLAEDMQYTSITTQISANWTASSDPETGIAKYWYAVGTSSASTNIVNWTDVGKSTYVVCTGLSLEDGKTYYFSVKAENNFNIMGAVKSSDGVTVDCSGPIAKINILSKDNIVKTGIFKIELILNDINNISGIPKLSYVLPNGIINDVILKWNEKGWDGESSYINSTCMNGIGEFRYTAVDSLGNTGTEISSGKSFVVDTSIDASGGATGNQDGTAVSVPQGVFAEKVNIIISNLNKNFAMVAEADQKIEVDKSITKIPGIDLYKNFSAIKFVGGDVINNFEKPVKIFIPYSDCNNDGIIDGSSICVDNLKIFYLDEKNNKWIALQNSICNKAENKIEAETNHFSIFCVMAINITTDESHVNVYPNPWHGTGYVYISNIPLKLTNAKILIYNIAGELVRTLEESNGIELQTGCNVGKWDGRNNNNEEVASGIYIYVLKSDENKTTGKIAVIR